MLVDIFALTRILFLTVFFVMDIEKGTPVKIIMILIFSRNRTL